MRAVRALGLQPAVFHLNEGHAAFLILELLREHLVRGLAVWRGARGRCGASVLHHAHTGGRGARCLRPRAARGAFQRLHPRARPAARSIARPGSRAHGARPVQYDAPRAQRHAQREWREPHTRRRYVAAVRGPVAGDSRRTKTRLASSPMACTCRRSCIRRGRAIFDQALGNDWRERLRDNEFWHAIEHVPDEQFWATAQSVKSRMLASVRERLQREYAAQGPEPRAVAPRHAASRPESPGHAHHRLRASLRHLQARRAAAAGSRAACASRERRRSVHVLFLFAGKAHPADLPGQQVLREIKQLMLDPGVRRPHRVPRGLRPAARALARVWRRRVAQQSHRAARSERHLGHEGGGERPPEPERARWLVGRGLDGRTTAGAFRPSTCRTPSGAMRSNAELLYDTLEEEALPLYYARNAAGFSPEWVRRCKRAMSTVVPRFNMRRAVYDYAQGVYYPLARHAEAPRRQRLRRGPYACRLEAASAPGVAQSRIAAACGCAGRDAARRAPAFAHRCRAQWAAAVGRSRGVRGPPPVAGVEPGAAAADVLWREADRWLVEHCAECHGRA